ncbi:hypothetical protein AAFF_G00180650 [Aldrovandia affinis]|uniref:Uncharacterized protein n=1 Tax=Aldrovandia affinis TaxID=143900 RepID=A0AAD7WVZ4_9TELE|nr:hypothetical protein AAFF_G00180650 [Aldrovandia affinis]
MELVSPDDMDYLSGAAYANVADQSPALPVTRPLRHSINQHGMSSSHSGDCCALFRLALPAAVNIWSLACSVSFLGFLPVGVHRPRGDSSSCQAHCTPLCVCLSSNKQKVSQCEREPSGCQAYTFLRLEHKAFKLS